MADKKVGDKYLILHNAQRCTGLNWQCQQDGHVSRTRGRFFEPSSGTTREVYLFQWTYLWELAR